MWKVFPCCLHANGEKGHFWAPAPCREGWRAANSEGNPAVPVAASEQRKPLSWWPLLCPLGHNYLDYSFPNVCFRVTEKCTTWCTCVLPWCQVLLPCILSPCVLKCNRDTTCLLKFILPVHKTEKKARFFFCSLTPRRMNKTPSK